MYNLGGGVTTRRSLSYRNKRSASTNNSGKGESSILSFKKAIAKHRDLGLSITHKVHLIEDHVVEQFWRLPFAFFYFIEEFVERQNQEGHKNKEIVKRIKNDDARATAKAKKLWVA
jgi:hypothetical protein